MHVVLNQYVNELKDQYGFDEKETKLFEYFANVCILSDRYSGKINPQEITTSGDDAGIDGLIIIIDGEVVLTEDDALVSFQSHKTGMQVDVIFNQSKITDGFVKAEIANFKMGIEDFLTLSPQLPMDDYLKEGLKIFKVVLENLKKIKNKRPDVYVYYCTTGTVSENREIIAAFDIIEIYLRDLGFFNAQFVSAVGRTELINKWGQINAKIESKIKVIEYMGLPAMPNIPQSYVAVVDAKEYVLKILMDKTGDIRKNIFEENIRSYLGNENDVNVDIAGSIKNEERSQIFSILNNGITIVCSDLALNASTKTVDLAGFQVINGCQTSHALFENYKEIKENSVSIIVKFIQSPNAQVSTNIISSTNNQSAIAREAFLGLKEKARMVQKFFEAKGKVVPLDGRIYFERRENEYINDVQYSRVFTIKDIIRAYASVIYEFPHDACRYVNKIIDNKKDVVFKEDDHECCYYAAQLIIYKLISLINGKKINAGKYGKFKYHIAMIYKWIALGEVIEIKPNSPKSEGQCSTLISTLTSEDRKYIKIFEQCLKVIDSFPDETEDTAKRGKLTAEIRDYVKANIKTLKI